MKKSVFSALLMAVAMVLSLSAVAVADDDAEKADDKPVKDVSWGGRIMNDWFWADVDDNVPNADDFVSGNEFRRARLFAKGTLYSNIEFKFNVDFAGGDADWKDVYMGLKGLPFGTLRLGHFKVPFSLNELTSSKYITFVERSLPMALVPSRETGLAILGSAGEKKKENVSYGFGVFTDADDYGEAEAHDDMYLFAGRVTFVPWQEGKDLFHLGAGFYYKDVDEGTNYRVRQRPETHLSPRVIDASMIDVDSVMAWNIEGAFVFGSMHGAGEYIMLTGDATSGDPEISGFYGYVGFYLTGDHRNYKNSAGAFDRTKPNNVFDGKGEGMGAWEVAARYSRLDYNEDLGDLELSDITVALNWYLNNYTVIKFNYVYFERGDLSDATGNQFVTRFQVDF
jgi:phosphate-selective porin OprO/OprP